MLHLRLPRKQRIQIWVGVVMFLYFAVYFLLLVHQVEWNKANPYQGPAHDANGVAIRP